MDRRLSPACRFLRPRLRDIARSRPRTLLIHLRHELAMWSDTTEDSGQSVGWSLSTASTYPARSPAPAGRSTCRLRFFQREASACQAVHWKRFAADESLLQL